MKPLTRFSREQLDRTAKPSRRRVVYAAQFARIVIAPCTLNPSANKGPKRLRARERQIRRWKRDAPESKRRRSELLFQGNRRVRQSVCLSLPARDAVCKQGELNEIRIYN